MDTSIVWTQFPSHVDVLTLHGLKDDVVPPYDAFIYSRAYGARTPGTHNLRYVEDADHNFTGVSTLLAVLTVVSDKCADAGRGDRNSAGMARVTRAWQAVHRGVAYWDQGQAVEGYY